ncbi:PIN-like domain-containing protein [Parvibaculum sp. MBR-TMA-1.3b-4.2]|jgi:hypothetical protein
MKNRFPQYFSLKPEEFDEIWKDALIVPDTNILLHLLRYGEATRNQVISTLEAFRPRVWIPHRVGKEFLRRWRDVDSENRKAYEKLKNGVEAKGRELRGLFDQFSRHQVINSEEEKKNIDYFIKGLCESLEASEKSHPSISDSEKIVEKISEIIGDMVGEEPNEEVLAKRIEEGAKRYDEKIPPGYMDAQKEGIEKYGDYFVWKEILEKAKSEESDVIFLSDDRKEDWVYKISGKDVGPRTELVEEFYKYTGKRFHSYSLVGFLEHSKRYINFEVSDQTLAEIEERHNAFLDRELEDFTRRSREVEFRRASDALRDLVDDMPKDAFKSYGGHFVDEYAFEARPKNRIAKKRVQFEALREEIGDLLPKIKKTIQILRNSNIDNKEENVKLFYSLYSNFHWLEQHFYTLKKKFHELFYDSPGYVEDEGEYFELLSNMLEIAEAHLSDLRTLINESRP